MANEYITISFKAGAEQVEMITALLMDSGFEGIEEQEDEVLASIPAILYKADEVRNIFESFKVSYTEQKVDQQNWNASWEQSFQPVRVKDFVSVRAAFHSPVEGVKFDLVVTPKMSFGTGHHDTTYMMMEEMETLDFKNKSVVDFGTGTGVLAILAEKLGAIDVLAIDNDEWSINNAKENIEANHCQNIRLLLAEKMFSQKKVDVILANINLNVIKQNLDEIRQACTPGAAVLISGFLADDEQTMHTILSSGGFHIIKNIYRNNWMAMLIKSV